MKNLLYSLMAVSMIAACQKAAEPTAAQEMPAEAKKLADSAPTAAEMKGVEEATAEGAKALTEEKLKAFLVYEREMLPHTRLAMGMATAAFQKAGKAMADEMSRDERLKVLQEAQKAALEKAGLTLAEIPSISLITNSYYPQRSVDQKSKADLEAASKRIAEARAKGTEPSIMDTAMESALREQLATHETERRDFEKEHGIEVVQLLEKHLAEYVELNEQRMKMLLP
jgi:hypothetical protein